MIIIVVSSVIIMIRIQIIANYANNADNADNTKNTNNTCKSNYIDPVDISLWLHSRFFTALHSLPLLPRLFSLNHHDQNNLQHTGSECCSLGGFGLAASFCCFVQCRQVPGLPHASAGVEASLVAGGRFTAVLALGTGAQDLGWKLGLRV